ncbi:3-oxoacyl-[acyl-carrier-protein] reductase [Parafilimonas sp.]|uniref:3-oxoacyl-[acyl-carrier-protein] reductase n=1 Tax=Parafilimonas sp. TaxID=1969739 RepID=UPI0039E297B2
MVNDKVCIITGAARGIGAAIVKKLAENGAHVAFTYISDSSAEKAAALESELSKSGVKVKAYKSNASDFAQCETLVNEVLKEFGKIDVCVNNAGISKDNLLLRLSPEQWSDVIDVNLNSVYNMTKQVIRPMIKAKSGNIINMSSIIGIRGNAGQASYAASKAGIIGFTKSVALELGSRNIRCNAIAPGFIETDMTHYLKEGTAADNFLKDIPLGRFGKAEEVANLTLFLASDMSAYITGEVISICGGLSI